MVSVPAMTDRIAPDAYTPDVLNAPNVRSWLYRHQGDVAEMLHGAQQMRLHRREHAAVLAGALVRRKQIRCVGYRARLKGHGTAGARLWEAVVDSGAGA